MKKVQNLIKKKKNIIFILILIFALIMVMDPLKIEAADMSGTTITRGQWLHDLTDLFGMSVEKENYPDNYFSDIDQNNEYYSDIMTATEIGLVDVEAGEKVCPTDPVTREFAVYTMNFCLGYTPNDKDTYGFNDKSDFTHANDENAEKYFDAAQVAVEQGWVALQNNKFLPQKNLTPSEKNTMWKEATDCIQSQIIDGNYKNKATFAEGVVEIPQETEYQFDEFNNAKFVTLFNYTGSLKDGDTFGTLAKRAANNL